MVLVGGLILLDVDRAFCGCGGDVRLRTTDRKIHGKECRWDIRQAMTLGQLAVLRD